MLRFVVWANNERDAEGAYTMGCVYSAPLFQDSTPISSTVSPEFEILQMARPMMIDVTHDACYIEHSQLPFPRVGK